MSLFVLKDEAGVPGKGGASVDPQCNVNWVAHINARCSTSRIQIDYGF